MPRTELWLNMGSRNSVRGIGEGEANEIYIIEHVEGDAVSGETLKVKFSGREKIYTGVKKIVAFGEGGSDTILVREGVRVPVELHGGPGTRGVVCEGPGPGGLYGVRDLVCPENGGATPTAEM